MSDKTKLPDLITPEQVNADNILDYYGVSFFCANCGHHNRRYVKKGVRQFLIAFPCDNCGCGVRGR